MKKPWAVRIVESLGWLYAILAVISMGVSLSYYLSKGDFPEAAMSGVSFLCFLALPAAMVLALRQGRRAWFVWSHTLIVLVVLMVAVAIPAVTAAVVALILLVSPIVLLFLPEASLWFHEMSIGRKHDRFGGWAAACMLLIFIAFVGGVIPCIALPTNKMYYAKASAMVHRVRMLHRLMIENNANRELGVSWVDSAACTNSTDFIMALSRPIEGIAPNLGRYTNIWCVVVNPPDDDMFPVLFTANMNPSELFHEEGGRRCISLTCPKKWGGECFGFCEKAAVVTRKGGATQIVKGKYVNWVAYANKQLAQCDAIHVLTPTGRVSVVCAPRIKPSEMWKEWGGRQYRAKSVQGIVHVQIREFGRIADVCSDASGYHRFCVEPVSVDELLLKSSDVGLRIIRRVDGEWVMQDVESQYK